MFDKGAFAVREGDYKLLIQSKGSAAELFNLGEDKGEAKNLAAAQPEKLQELEKRRVEWSSQLIAPVFEGLETKKKNAKTAKGEPDGPNE